MQIKLQDILDYWRATRGAGHSKAQVSGITEPTLLVTYDYPDKAWVSGNKCAIACQSTYTLRGQSLPLVVDHYMLDRLIEEDRREREEPLLKSLRYRDIQIAGLKDTLAARDAEIAKIRKQESAVCKAIDDLEKSLGINTEEEYY